MEPRRRRERVQHLLQPPDLVFLCPDQDQGVVSVLDDGAPEVIDQRMHQPCALAHHQTVEQISNDEEEVGAQRIPLLQSPTALDPGARHAVQEDGSLARGEERAHHPPPLLPEAPHC